MINLLFLFIAVTLSIISLPLAIVFTIITALSTGDWQKGWDYLSGVAYSVAYCLDLLANFTCGGFLNNTMRMSGGYPFGIIQETMSRAYGMNKHRGTLSGMGYLIARTLNFCQAGHIELAANLPMPVGELTFSEWVADKCKRIKTKL